MTAPQLEGQNALQRLGRRISDLPSRIARTPLGGACGLTALCLLPSFSAYWTFTLVWRSGSVPAAVAALVCLSGLQLVALWLATGQRFVSIAKHLAKTEHPGAAHFPIVVATALLCLSVLFFSALSSLLARLGVVTYVPSAPLESWTAYGDLYLWHFLNSIPGFKVPDVLNWAVPYKYDGALPGALILTYQGLVLATVLRLYKTWKTPAAQ